jgi:hypothetical protein
MQGHSRSGHRGRISDFETVQKAAAVYFFLPVIGEVLQLKAGAEYFRHFRNKLQPITAR